LIWPANGAGIFQPEVVPKSNFWCSGPTPAPSWRSSRIRFPVGVTMQVSPPGNPIGGVGHQCRWKAGYPSRLESQFTSVISPEFVPLCSTNQP
jgi:hypothetical protein